MRPTLVLLAGCFLLAIPAGQRHGGGGVAAQGLDAMGTGDADSSIAQRVSPGACGDLRLDELHARLEYLKLT